ncbi:MAG: hypothetical protein BWX81_02068 [Spirochaetes bacterium ADurb.Bin110]|nr:MAG: hypothetical protein BWX81_02068 [Spirochaetes bacterium ADurb.Bin110]HNV37186.1 GNAT family N-acetyltransferase [Rectinema sp.]
MISEPLQVSIYRDIETPAAIWDSLAKGPRIYAFQTRAWLSIWQNTIGNAHGVVPCIIAFKKGQNTALFPLGKKKVRFGALSCTMLIWLGYGVSDYSAPIFSNEAHFDMAELFAQLKNIAKKEHCCAIYLDRIPRFWADRTPLVFAQALLAITFGHRLHYSAHAMRLSQNPLIRLSTKERAHLRRAERRLSEAGTLSFIIAGDKPLRERLTRTMISFKRARFRQIKVHDNFTDPAYRDFYIQASQNDNIPVHISALMLDEKPLAVHWGLSCQPRLYYLMPAFDIDNYPSLSTGNLLLFKLLDYCAKNDYQLVDFANGDEPYKEKWCDVELPLYEVYIPASLAGWFTALYGSASESIKRSALAPHLKKMAQFLKLPA